MQINAWTMEWKVSFPETTILFIKKKTKKQKQKQKTHKQKKRNRYLREKLKDESALLTAVTLAAHLQRTVMANFNACAPSNRNFGFQFLISYRALSAWSPLTTNTKALRTSL